MNFNDMIKSLFGPKYLKKLNKSNKHFHTNSIGGLSVDVISLVNNKNIFRYECYMKNSYLRNFIIKENDHTKLTDYIVLIRHFGIVDNINKIKNNNDINNIPVLLFSFDDAKDYIEDTMGDNLRINKIQELNLLKYNFTLRNPISKTK